MYCARDKIVGKDVTPEQQRRLWKLQTSNTNDAIGKLPLIPGMPVMITENAATSCKNVNGSRGILKSVTYDIDAEGNRFPLCALVDIPESTLHISGLEKGIIPIFTVTNSFSFPTGEKNTLHTQLQGDACAEFSHLHHIEMNTRENYLRAKNNRNGEEQLTM
ncbi:hypothetical protein F4604DRAFT_1673758 [Suillus subluteus]|nr:hypothetical protein F4604DRAFT_1673758 [Suillus subluteus]